jgi:hypothetical protein
LDGSADTTAIVGSPRGADKQVQVTVQVKQSVARESAGMLRWRGDWETLRRLAEDDEFGIMESP